MVREILDAGIESHHVREGGFEVAFETEEEEGGKEGH